VKSGGFRYDYPRPAVTVDTVVFGYQEGELSLLLIERGLSPYKGAWALPGGFVHLDETLDAAAKRELAEEAGVHDVYLEQLYTFGRVDRDPRERVLSVAYFALVKPAQHALKATTDATNAKWFPVSHLPKVAFDHAEIIDVAVRRLRMKVRYEPIGFELLPLHFTLTQLQTMYETILGHELDRRNFRKKFQALEVLHKTKVKLENVPHRSPALFKFDPVAYRRMLKSGIQFEI
jgi:8-oxo-dGTP diphosphatase